MTTIPEFPIFEPVTMDMAEDLHAFCEALTSGISEFTFANIYIDTLKYKYQASQVSTETVIVTGISPSRSFMEHQLEGSSDGFCSGVGNTLLSMPGTTG